MGTISRCMCLCSLIVNWDGRPWETVPGIGEADNPGPVVYFDGPEIGDDLEYGWEPLPVPRQRSPAPLEIIPDLRIIEVDNRPRVVSFSDPRHRFPRSAFPVRD